MARRKIPILIPSRRCDWVPSEPFVEAMLGIIPFLDYLVPNPISLFPDHPSLVSFVPSCLCAVVPSYSISPIPNLCSPSPIIPCPFLTVFLAPVIIPMPSSVAQWQSNRLLTGRLVVRVHSEEPLVNLNLHILTQGLLSSLVRTRSLDIAGFLIL